MRINVEEKSGFCSGVLRVVRLADQILDSGEDLYCLGQIVHNELEVKRLMDKGLKFISYEDLNNLHDCRVLLRAHGEPPETYQIAKNNNIEIIDGTCPIVKRIQNRIRRDGINGGQVIIFGKINHPEVRGLKAQVKGRIYIIGSEEEAERIELSDKIYLYAQTTMDAEKYRNISSILKRRIHDKGGELVVNKTICGYVSHRLPGLIRFAKENDVIVFIAGSNSSNGRMLFSMCRAENERSHFITDPEEIKKDWFVNAESIGISGATSTPRWQIEKAYQIVENMLRE